MGTAKVQVLGLEKQDLSNYYTIPQTTELLRQKQDKIVNGTSNVTVVTLEPNTEEAVLSRCSAGNATSGVTMPSDGGRLVPIYSPANSSGKGGGRLRTNTPAADFDAANKKYVDDGLAAKLDATTEPYVVYGTTTGGNDYYYAIETVGGISSNAIVSRYYGALRVRENPSDPREAISKSYCDAKITSVEALITNTVALAVNKGTKEVNITSLLGDSENCDFVEVMMRNALNYTVAVVINEEAYEEAPATFQLIPRKPLTWDTPTECNVLGYDCFVDMFENGDYRFSLTEVSAAVLTFTSSDCKAYLRIVGTYTVDNYYEDEIEGEWSDWEESHTVGFDTNFEIKAGSWVSSAGNIRVDLGIKLNVVLNEEVLNILPTTLSLEEDVTELERETLKMLN